MLQISNIIISLESSCRDESNGSLFIKIGLLDQEIVDFKYFTIFIIYKN